VPLAGTDRTGLFWFFDAGNLELVAKVIDVAKGAKGRIFSIYTPSDLASAVERMSSGRP